MPVSLEPTPFSEEGMRRQRRKRILLAVKIFLLAGMVLLVFGGIKMIKRWQVKKNVTPAEKPLDPTDPLDDRNTVKSADPADDPFLKTVPAAIAPEPTEPAKAKTDDPLDPAATVKSKNESPEDLVGVPRVEAPASGGDSAGLDPLDPNATVKSKQ